MVYPIYLCGGTYKADSFEEALDIIEARYRKHHTSYARGYLSRKGTENRIISYSGRFGTGYIVETPAWETTNYHHITYYVID